MPRAAAEADGTAGCFPDQKGTGMASLTDHVRRVALDEGAALVDFAPIERFHDAPPACHPATIFPQTKTAIAIALPQPRLSKENAGN